MKNMEWKAWLPITFKAKPRPADVKWFEQRGVSKEMLTGALSALRHMRKDLLPDLYKLSHVASSHMCLIHELDGKAHLDVTIRFWQPADPRRQLSRKWRNVKPAEKTTAISGIDLSGLKNTKIRGSKKRYEPIDRAKNLIAAQCDWYLQLIDNYRPSTTDIDLLKQIGQFLHYFANMSQLVIC